MMATRWGIISAGKIASDFVTAMKSLPSEDHTIIGVAARDKGRAEQFAKQHKIPLAFGSYQELLDNSDIEVVYIGVLHPYHFEVAKMSLEHGKSVLCEKPLCMNLKETKLLVEVAKKKKLFLMEAVWSRCLPAYGYLRQLLLDKSIGDPLFLDVSFGAKIDVDRIWKKELGGGTVLDLGIYTLQMAMLVFGGQPSSVVAAGHLNTEGVDVDSVTVLTYPAGGTAVCSTHSKVQLPNTAHIVGTKGTITIHSPFWSATKIMFSPQKGKTEEKEFSLPESKGSFNFVNSVGLSYEAAEVRRCLREGLKESPLVTHEDSLTLARLEDEVRRQLKVFYPQDD
ncbi:trans-1,2-dihydrobenzene-1,2-diol dehydrogenase-like isoform X1 [Macrosteles quadrilineatus]|uniref:trans-1,2-dihydrobenzene-1,2-diol dehydrogenase-like isoform X1 n=2 Tax=Macrosteles quadrilineatus TaxID=74068 RepID=UPI0023E2FCB2|nr:trans-1,2-dihydrobenzene-1,2-diol dehydrogenase-like isoform X1 [Macrosteles quadrilineatus]